MSNLAWSTSLEDFKQNLRKRYSFIEDLLDTQANSYGFKFNEPAPEVDVCYYGCSFTYGQGVSPEECWTQLVDHELKLQSNNFALPGLGIDEILILFSTTTKFINMKQAVFLLPPMSRQNIAYQDKFLTVFPGYRTTEQQNSAKYQLADTWFKLPKEYFKDRAVTAIALIERIAELEGIKCHWATWSDDVYQLLPRPASKFSTIDCSYDQVHPGSKSHKQFAEEIVKLL